MMCLLPAHDFHLDFRVLIYSIILTDIHFLIFVLMFMYMYLTTCNYYFFYYSLVMAMKGEWVAGDTLDTDEVLRFLMAKTTTSSQSKS